MQKKSYLERVAQQGGARLSDKRSTLQPLPGLLHRWQQMATDGVAGSQHLAPSVAEEVENAPGYQPERAQQHTAPFMDATNNLPQSLPTQKRERSVSRPDSPSDSHLERFANSAYSAPAITPPKRSELINCVELGIPSSQQKRRESRTDEMTSEIHKVPLSPILSAPEKVSSPQMARAGIRLSSIAQNSGQPGVPMERTGVDERIKGDSVSGSTQMLDNDGRNSETYRRAELMPALWVRPVPVEVVTRDTGPKEVSEGANIHIGEISVQILPVSPTQTGQVQKPQPTPSRVTRQQAPLTQGYRSHYGWRQH